MSPEHKLLRSSCGREPQDCTRAAALPGGAWSAPEGRLSCSPGSLDFVHAPFFRPGGRLLRRFVQANLVLYRWIDMEAGAGDIAAPDRRYGRRIPIGGCLVRSLRHSAGVAVAARRCRRTRRHRSARQGVWCTMARKVLQFLTALPIAPSPVAWRGPGRSLQSAMGTSEEIPSKLDGFPVVARVMSHEDDSGFSGVFVRPIHDPGVGVGGECNVVPSNPAVA